MLYSKVKALIANKTTYFDNYKFILDSGQTLISDSDEFGNVLFLDSDKYQVFVNGFRIIEGEDYSANIINNSITLISSPTVDDEVIISNLRDKNI